MNRKPKTLEGVITLEDQKILKELGIASHSPGLAHLLEQRERAMSDLDKIEARAEGLQALALNRKTLEKLSAERNQPLSELRDGLAFYRDLEEDEDPSDEP